MAHYLTPEDLQAASELSVNADKQDQLALQLKLAAALRNKGFAKGQMAGAVYIPPNPLETATDVYDRLQGIKDTSQGTAQMSGLLGNKQSNLLKLLKDKFGLTDNDLQGVGSSSNLGQP